MNRDLLIRAVQPLVGCTIRGEKILRIDTQVGTSICPERAEYLQADVALVTGDALHECGACGGLHRDAFLLSSAFVKSVRYDENENGAQAARFTRIDGSFFDFVLEAWGVSRDEDNADAG